MTEHYAVTGAGGYLGSWIVRLLLAQGAHVAALSRTEQGAKSIPEGAEIVLGDLHDASALDRLLRRAPGQRLIVIHAAAVVSVDHRDKEAYRTNAEGTRAILAACRRAKADKLLYVSSVDALGVCDAEDGIVREPDTFLRSDRGSAYALSKAEASQAVLDAAHDGLDAVILLPSCLLGPGDSRKSFTTVMLSVYLHGIPPVGLSGGFDFADVRDVAEAILAAKNAPSGECFLLTNTFLRVTDIFDVLAGHLGRPRTKWTLPTGILYLVLPVTWLYSRVTGKRAPISGTAIRLLRAHPTYSYEKAAAQLCYQPRDMKESITETADWMLAHRSHGG